MSPDTSRTRGSSGIGIVVCHDDGWNSNQSPDWHPAVFPGSLTDQTQVVGRAFPVAAKRVDIQATTAGIAGVNRQVLGMAVALQVDEYPLDALFVKLVVLAEGD